MGPFFLFVSLTDLLAACIGVLQGWLVNFVSDAELGRLGPKRSMKASGATSRSMSQRPEDFPFSVNRIGAHELGFRLLGKNSAKVEYKCQQPHSFFSRNWLANELGGDSQATQHLYAQVCRAKRGTALLGDELESLHEAHLVA